MLLNLDPLFADPITLASHEFEDDLALEAMRLRQLVRDAELMGDLEELARPWGVVNWALRQFIPVPQALLDLAVARGLPIQGYPSPLDEAKAENRALLAKAGKALSERNAKITALESEVAQRCAAIEALTQRLEAKAQRAATTDEAAQVPTTTNLAGLSRTHNYVSALFYVVLEDKFGVVVGGMKKPDVRTLMTVLAKRGFKPDDETLSGYLLHGAEQAARLAKSPKS